MSEEKNTKNGFWGGIPREGGMLLAGVAPSALSARVGQAEDARAKFERAAGEALLFLCMLPPYEGCICWICAIALLCQCLCGSMPCGALVA